MTKTAQLSEATPDRDESGVAIPFAAQTEAMNLVADESFTATLFFPQLVIPGWHFFPQIEFAEATVVDLYPRHEQTELSPNVNLRWAPDVSQADITKYRVYLDANGLEPSTLIGETTQPFLDPPTLALDTQYYWRVSVIDRNGSETSSPVQTFRTESPFSPDKLGSMVQVPAGEFLMGCDPNVPSDSPCIDIERPLHAVYLNAYEIDKYEVTNQEYQACVAAGACNPPHYNNSRLHDFYYGNPDFDLFPVIYVSWWDSQDYCAWNGGKRLPTEAEWEKAARGTIDTRTWPWGVEAPDCSRQNFTIPPTKEFCAGGDTNRVGSYPAGASPYGVMDMSGNVFEWVFDKYGTWYYAVSPYENPTGPDISRDEFVLRGGSFQDNWWYTTVVHRHYGHHGNRPFGDSPFFRNRKTGFRCARSLGE